MAQYIKYTQELLEANVPEVESFAALARRLDKVPIGSTLTHLRRRCEFYEIDTSHFTGQGHQRGKGAKNKRTPSEILVYNEDPLARREQPHRLRRALFESGVKDECKICGIVDWMGVPIQLQVDHINGIHRDNRIHNLRLLCPNCHTQTDNWGRQKQNA